MHSCTASLKRESITLQKLASIAGTPKLIKHGVSITDHPYMVLEKNGPSLDSVLEKMHKEMFSLKTTVQVGLQLINHLQNLHKLRFVNVGVSLSSICLGSADTASPESSTLILTNFEDSFV